MQRGRILDKGFLSCPSDLEYVRCFVRFFIIIVIIIIFYLFLCKPYFFIINSANFDLKLIRIEKQMNIIVIVVIVIMVIMILIVVLVNLFV
jgi:hypothetical protein